MGVSREKGPSWLMNLKFVNYKYFLFILCFGIESTFFSSTAFAFVLNQDSSGNVKRWASPYLQFFFNELNISGLSAGDIRTAATNSLSRWRSVGTALLGFDYWQGNSTVNATVAFDGRNTIFFQSQSSAAYAGAGVIGVTYVYSSGSNILEADVVLNDRNFIFTTDPSDSTNGSIQSKVFIENVLTHELGHVYGLSHSNSLQSSMMWQEAKGQSKPSCDDENGVAALYPNFGYTSQTGSISGSVRAADGTTSIFGAHIHAISKRRGTSVSATVSDPAGNFVFQNLEPGQYVLLVEPFTNIIGALCGGSSIGCYWGATNAQNVCGGFSFSRFFVEASPGVPALFTVSTARTTSVGSFAVPCSSLTERISGVGASSFPNQTPQLGQTGVAYGVMPSSNEKHYYKIPAASGQMKVRALAYSLYSPLDVSVDILDSGGNSAAMEKRANVFPWPMPAGNYLGYVNYDSLASVNNAPLGNYFAQIIGVSSLGTSKYPGAGALDGKLFYLLMATLNDVTPLVTYDGTNPYLPDNPRCENADSFSPYPDHGVPPPLQVSSGSSAGMSGGESAATILKGACGTIYSSGRSGSDDNRARKVNYREVLFSVWGILLMLLLSRLAFRISTR